MKCGLCILKLLHNLSDTFITKQSKENTHNLKPHKLVNKLITFHYKDYRNDIMGTNSSATIIFLASKAAEQKKWREGRSYGCAFICEQFVKNILVSKKTDEGEPLYYSLP